jgi:hypothetical protein
LGGQMKVVRILIGEEKRFVVFSLAGLSERVQRFVH